jgi:hypothetical protein
MPFGKRVAATAVRRKTIGIVPSRKSGRVPEILRIARNPVVTSAKEI